jgi:hypothetical protein
MILNKTLLIYITYMNRNRFVLSQILRQFPEQFTRFKKTLQSHGFGDLTRVTGKVANICYDNRLRYRSCNIPNTLIQCVTAEGSIGKPTPFRAYTPYVFDMHVNRHIQYYSKYIS